MSDIAISVEGLGKKYNIGRKKSGELRETFSHLWNKFKPSTSSINSVQEGFTRALEENEFWALKDISFEVKRGEAVGIIGRNGAGKSTLLKVLSRITKPTTGRFEIDGRVSSLLEVGTGFHPELTGRENIYLNGTILGMRRGEIKAKFDEIIAFSGVEEFLDTPVKHYSSGMKVRLAFSVAAHLEPEILIIDEVLAVGDAEFQKKCLGKMEDVTGEGRTVLFVSHNMGALKTLCEKSILVDGGMIKKINNTSSIIEEYLGQNVINKNSFKRSKKKEYDSIYFTNIETEIISDILKIHLGFKVNKNTGCAIAVKVSSMDGSPVLTSLDTDLDLTKFNKTIGNHISKLEFSIKDFAKGKYFITFSISDMKSERFDYLDGIISFEKTKQNSKNTYNGRQGAYLPEIYWY